MASGMSFLTTLASASSSPSYGGRAKGEQEQEAEEEEGGGEEEKEVRLQRALRTRAGWNLETDVSSRLV